MGYLDPYTPWIVQQFQKFLSLPTIVYFAIMLALFVIGVGVYLTSTDFSLEDILSLLPSTIISVRKSINKRRVSAIFLILLGLFGLFTFADQLNVEAYQASIRGGGSTNPASSCPVGSPCLTQFQHGEAVTCSIPTNLVSCSATVTFSPAYTVTPVVRASVAGVSPPSHAQSFNDASSYTLQFLTPPNGTRATQGWTWTAMNTHDTPVELFGNTTARQFVATYSGTTTVQLCVDVQTASGNNTATLGLQSSPDQTTWTDVGTSAFRANVGSSTGVQCGSSQSVSFSNDYLRIVGRDGCGLTGVPGCFGEDFVTFGTIFLSGTYTSSFSFNYILPETLGFTNSATQTVITCNIGQTPSGTFTCKFDWFAGIPA